MILSREPRTFDKAGIVYRTVRFQILDGQLAPGDSFSELGLAQQLGVSRTPVREAIRRLQDEGLLKIELNHQPVVTPFDAEDVDTLYAQRIVSEALALRLSLGSPAASLGREVRQTALEALHTAAERGDLTASEEAHRRLHLALLAGAPESLKTAVARLVDATDRYRRWLLRREQAAWFTATFDEHKVLLEAADSEDPDWAVRVVARHLARTALMALAAASPEHEPRSVRAALVLLDATDEQRREQAGNVRNPRGG